MLPSPVELVARYLRTNGYDETLDKFIEEAGLEPDAGSGTGVTIDQILQEKKTFDLSLSFEKLGTDDGEKGWRNPDPSISTILEMLPTRSNIISAHVLGLILPGSSNPRPCIAATTADRRLNLVDLLAPSHPLLESYDQFQDSPLLDLAVVEEKYLLAGSMSGKLVLFNTASKNVIDERKDHSKYLVKIATWSVGDSTLVATAGWDAKVHLYQLNLADAENARLGTPLATLTLPSIPETITFVKDPEASLPVLLLTRRDSTFLFYYDLVNGLELKLLGKQNLAPHSNAWVVFSPSDVQVCPTDPSIAAVATSSTPHMKLLVVRLLVPPRRHSMNRSGTGASEGISNSSPLNSGDDAAPLTQAAQARAELVVQEREEAAILINTNTMSPQTAYSTPKLAWRPDGTGIYVTSEDGVIRGFETSSGKLMVSLAAHEPGSKVRCLWAGTVEGGTSQDGGNGIECLVSGGFDQKLILWKASEI